MNSGDFISGELCHLRKLSHIEESDFRRKFPDSLHLTPEVVVHREYFAAQPRWMQHKLRAIAAGMSTYRAVLVGKAAASVAGIPVLSDGPIELCLPGGVKAPSPKCWPEGVIYRNWVLADDDWTVHNGIRVTLGRRTVLDIARTGTLADALAAMDYSLHTHQTTRNELEEQLGKYKRMPGLRRARYALGHASQIAESPLESWARAQLIEAGIMGFELQVVISGYRVDMLLDGWLVIEVDGMSKYIEYGEERKWDKEKQRNDALLAAGYAVIHVMRKDLAMRINGESEFIHKVKRMLEQTHPLGRH